MRSFGKDVSPPPSYSHDLAASAPLSAPYNIMRAPLATQEDEEELELGPPKAQSSKGTVNLRYGSLPVQKKSGDGTGGGGGHRSTTKNRISAHFSEPSLVEQQRHQSQAMALSAGHRISPVGDLRGSRPASVVGQSAPTLVAKAYKVLTPHLHRPENAVSRAICDLLNVSHATQHLFTVQKPRISMSCILLMP